MSCPAPVASSSVLSTGNGTATDPVTASSFKSPVGTNLTTSTLPSSSGTVLFNASFTTTLDPTDSSLLPTASSPSGAAASSTGTVASTSASVIPTSGAATFTSDGTTFTSDGTTFTFDGTTFTSDRATLTSDAVTATSAATTTTSPSPSPSSNDNDDDDDLVGLIGGGGSSTTVAPPSATTTGAGGGGSDSPSDPSLPGTVAGSVLGGIAGVAFILVLALVFLRWKKRQMNGKGQSPRGLLTGTGAGAAGFKTGTTNTPEPGPGSGPGGDHSSAGSPVSRTMTQRSSLPFIPASLANLAGSKRYSDRTATSSETGEKGFQKVSGRKLPSVLHYGGDGYTEPGNQPGNRDTVMSEQSSNRDSIAMFTGPGMPRLALGSPMRPESGIVVFHDGPSRTPQQSHGAFSPTLSPPARDPLGRSHPSQDGSSRSHSSFSRFTEQI